VLHVKGRSSRLVIHTIRVQNSGYKKSIDMGTKRKQIIDLLSKKEMDARELSQAVGIREKEVYEHLPHIARSAFLSSWSLPELQKRVHTESKIQNNLVPQCM
jgi:DNA-directed RNA polymerase specialized sigma subunit